MSLPTVVVSSTTSTTTGASLSPDSASMRVCSREGSRNPRATVKTAAASVGARTAAISTAVRRSIPVIQCSGQATSMMLSATPRVASRAAGTATGRTVAVRVVNPPSARMMTSPAYPKAVASSASLKTIPPGPSSPSTRPSPR